MKILTQDEVEQLQKKMAEGGGGGDGEEGGEKGEEGGEQAPPYGGESENRRLIVPNSVRTNQSLIF